MPHHRWNEITDEQIHELLDAVAGLLMQLGSIAEDGLVSEDPPVSAVEAAIDVLRRYGWIVERPGRWPCGPPQLYFDFEKWIAEPPTPAPR